MSDQTVTTQKSKYQNFLDGVLSNWHFMRWLRLAIGLFFSWQMVQRPDIFTGLVAGVFLFQAITNTGCCGASVCAPPETGTKTATKEKEEIEYEEI
jgi:hypothetical protein